MKNKFLGTALLSALALSLTSCSVVTGIFKAGMGIGIFAVLAVLVVVAFVIMKIRGRK